MNKMKIVLLAALVVMAFASCDKEEDQKEDVVEVVSETYVGKLSVDQTDGTFFTMDSVSVDVNPVDGDSTVVMVMHGVTFSARMPVALDMTVNGIAYTSTTTNVSLSGNNLVPIAMGGEFPAYTITNYAGTITDGKLSFSMVCGKFPLTFTGSK